MRERDLAALEFPSICRHLADCASSALGKDLCLATRPTADRRQADAALQRTWQTLELIEEHGRPPLGAFPDIRPDLRRAAHEGFTLDGEALVGVRGVLEQIHECSAFLRRHAARIVELSDLLQRLRPLPDVESALHRCLDHDGQVLDQASDELAAVRRNIRRLRESISRRLEELVARRSMADVVSDDYVTIRNDRFVVPVRAGATARLPGVVQDRSVSGETFFVEPLFAVELNNELLMAVREEEAIVRRVLADLTDLVRRNVDEIETATLALAELDASSARARFAVTYRCTRPHFSDGEIDVRDARHPGLLFTGRTVTPIDILLPSDKRILVVTGPNTGGKTVALKTLGLCALMAQSGLLIPAAAGAKLPCVPAVFTDIGDDQNVERDLSTFSAHIANLREILHSPAALPLVLLDEPGVGTDPDEGAALAVGLLRYFEERDARIAITTHYRGVKVHAMSSERCTVAAVDFDAETLRARYRLIYHSLGRSMALPIAERLGLPNQVLQAAREARSHESQVFSDALARLEASRQELETARQRAQQELEELRRREAAVAAREQDSERLLEQARERKSRAWGDELREARIFVRDLKQKGRQRLRELQRAPTERAEFAQFVHEQEEAIAAHTEIPAAATRSDALPGPLQEGDLVEVGDRGIQGELLSVEGDRAWIQRGSLRFEVPAGQLHRVRRGGARKPPVRVNLPQAAGSPQEITLVGMRAREAVAQLDRFLDGTAQTDLSVIRIIHGVGSGALQRAVHEYLSKSGYCAEFRSGEEGEGGAGVTIVTMN
jgi:DNA mismatch repair protein MutS2